MNTSRVGGSGVGWAFWCLWLLATIVGSAAGLGIAAGIFVLMGYTSDSAAPGGAGTLEGGAGAALGAGIGSAQLLVLRRFLDRASAWAWSLVVSYGIGFALTGVFEDVSFYRAVGPAFLALAGGLLQWMLVLRGRVMWSGWWVPVSAVGFYLGLGLGAGSQPLLASVLGLSAPSYIGQSWSGVEFALALGAMIGVGYGLVTGSTLGLLLRRKTTSTRATR